MYFFCNVKYVYNTYAIKSVIFVVY